MQQPAKSWISLSGTTLGFLFLGVLLALQTAIPRNEAIATPPPPPPPTEYTLTVRTEGGDSTCFVRIVLPEPSAWTSSSVSEVFDAYSVYEVEADVVCPSNYKFSHWESEEDSDLNGYHENHSLPELELSEDITATAVFVARILPDEESTEWHEHYLSYPHRGDSYKHQVSLSSDATQNFGNLSINEDFLPADMDTSNCSMSLTTTQKSDLQSSWDGSWEIDADNYREELDGKDSEDQYDAHGFNPYADPWEEILVDETFTLKQRMRVEGCVSVNNVGPWFAEHDIVFKVIKRPGVIQREVFVKKSGESGDGDPSF